MKNLTVALLATLGFVFANTTDSKPATDSKSEMTSTEKSVDSKDSKTAEKPAEEKKEEAKK